MDEKKIENKIIKSHDNNAMIKTFDISDIQYDFIYQMINYYLTEISLKPNGDLVESTTNLVDTIMSYYLLAQKNGVINMENSRKMLSLKLGNRKYNNDVNQISFLDQCKKMNDDFDALEKKLKSNTLEHSFIPTTSIIKSTDNSNLLTIQELAKKYNKNTLKNNCDIQIDELINGHDFFMSEISKRSDEIKKLCLHQDNNLMSDNNTNYIKILKKKLKNNIETVSERIKQKSNTINELSNNSINAINDSFFESSDGVKISSTPDFTDVKNKSMFNLDNIIDEKPIESVKKITKKYMNHEKQTNSLQNLAFSGSCKTSTDLTEAIEKLCSRFDTPIMNLAIFVIIIKITAWLVSYIF